MPNVIELLRGRLQQRADNAEDVLAQAARDHAAGQTIDIGAVEQAIVETGRTLDDFTQLCDTAAKRREALGHFDRLAAASGKLKKALAAIEAEEARFEEARVAHVERMHALDRARAEAQTAVSNGEQARGLLLDPKLVLGTLAGKYRRAIADRDEASNAVSTLAKELKEARDDVKSEEEWITQIETPKGLTKNIVGQDSGTSYKYQDHVNAKARAQRRVADLEPRLKAAELVLERAERSLAAMQVEIVKN